MGLLALLDHAVRGEPNDQFDEVFRRVSTQDIAHGLSAVFRSSQTPPFGDMVAELFRQSSPQQQAGLLNHLKSTCATVISAQPAQTLLAKLLDPVSGPVSARQASQLTPAEVRDVVTGAAQACPAVIDEVCGFYAQHAVLLKMLGCTALLLTMRSMKNNLVDQEPTS